MGRRLQPYTLWRRADAKNVYYAKSAHGSWVSTGKTGRKQAVAWCEMRWGEGPKDGGVDEYTTVAVLIDRYFQEDCAYVQRLRLKNRMGESHRVRCRLRIRQILEDDLLPHRPVTKLSLAEVEGFFLRMGARHSPTVLQQMRSVLVTVGNEELRLGRLQRNPFKGVTTIPDKPLREVPVLSVEEMDKLFANPWVFGEHQLFVYFKTLQLTAARRSEVLALKWSSVDFDTNTLTFSEAQKDNAGRVTGSLKSRKPGDVRKLRMSDTLAALLKEHYRRSEYKMPGCRVFGRPQDNSPLRWSFVDSRWHTALKRAGITKRVGIHACGIVSARPWRMRVSSLRKFGRWPDGVTSRFAGATSTTSKANPGGARRPPSTSSSAAGRATPP